MAVAQVRAGANYGGYFTKGYYVGAHTQGDRSAAPTLFLLFFQNFGERERL